MANDKIPSRHLWDFGDGKFELDKETLIRSYIGQMFDRTSRMFEYSDLPETIPAKDSELILQPGGYEFIFKNEGKGASKPNGKLYAAYGGWGGEQNPYYLPTIATIANPYLGFNGQLRVGVDCEIILNDSLFMGLLPINKKYAALLAETDISLRIACVNARILKLVMANDDATAESAKEYFRKVDEGKELGVIANNDLFDSLKSQDYASGVDGAHIKELIEVQQYLKSQWYIELGLNSNYNMKREAINAAESGMNDDILLPLVDDMLNQRRLGWERVNKHFGTSVKVNLSSSWKQIHAEYHEEESPKEVKEDGQEANQ